MSFIDDTQKGFTPAFFAGVLPTDNVIFQDLNSVKLSGASERHFNSNFWIPECECGGSRPAVFAQCESDLELLV
jgi:hypothetical protein